MEERNQDPVPERADEGVVVESAPPPRVRAWYALLLVPFVALLWLPFYASEEPRLFGFPFFYWYQFLWVPLTALICAFVHWRTK